MTQKKKQNSLESNDNFPVGETIKTGYYEIDDEGDDEELDDETEDQWDSGLSTVKPLVIVPNRILQVCRTIQDKIENREFSILVKGNWTERGFELTEDYCIPKQKVTSTHIDFKENLFKKRQEFNTSIHSHPFTDDAEYSETDDGSVNSHFDCAMLFDNSNNLKQAILNIPITDKNGEEAKLNIEASVKISHEDIEVDTSNIEEAEIEFNYVNYYDKFKRFKKFGFNGGETEDD